MKLEVRDVSRLGDKEVEVRTREFWITRTFWLESGEASDPPRSDVVACKYHVALDAGIWRVMAWDFDESPGLGGFEAGAREMGGEPGGPAPEAPEEPSP